MAAKSVSDNTLIVVQGDHPALYGQRLQTEAVNWIAGEAPSTEFRCTARIRYRQQDQDCLARVLDPVLGIFEVQFDQPQRAITAGQSVVFYQGEVCLGGGVIALSDGYLGGLPAV